MLPSVEPGSCCDKFYKVYGENTEAHIITILVGAIIFLLGILIELNLKSPTFRSPVSLITSTGITVSLFGLLALSINKCLGKNKI